MNFQFKIHGFFSLHNHVFVEESEPKCGSEHCFTICAGDKILILAALWVSKLCLSPPKCRVQFNYNHSSESDRQAWIHDIRQSVIEIQSQQHALQKPPPPPIVTNDLLSKIDSALNEHWNNKPNNSNPQSSMIAGNVAVGATSASIEFDQLEKMQSHANNNIVHVCWQRACSISATDYRFALTVSVLLKIPLLAFSWFLWLLKAFDQ